MMRLGIVMLAVCMTGCMSYQVYEPTGSLPVRTMACSCCQPVTSTRQQLADGITLDTSVFPEDDSIDVIIGLELAPGRTARLADTVIHVSWQGSEGVDKSLTEFVSGAEGFLVPLVRLSADDRLTGTDRMRHLRPPYGPNESFDAGVKMHMAPPPILTVEAPAVLIDGVKVVPKASTFKLETAREFCIQ